VLTQRHKLIILFSILLFTGGCLETLRPDVPIEFIQQHAALQGTWVLGPVEGGSPDFYILHSFQQGRYETRDWLGTYDRGKYRILSAEEDGEFEIEMTSSRYGFTVTMDVQPQADPTLIKLDHQLFRKSASP